MIDRELQTRLHDIIYLLNRLAVSSGAIKDNTAGSSTGQETIEQDLDSIISSLTSLVSSTGDNRQDISAIKAKTNDIYSVLNDRLVKKVILTRAEYDALVNRGTVDNDTLYYVIESQTN